MINKKIFAVMFCAAMIFTGVQTSQGIHIVNQKMHSIIGFDQSATSSETEYWGLLIAVGIYLNHPDEDRPSMLDSVEGLYSTLLKSDNWDSNHIKKIKAEDATLKNMRNGLNWLVKNEGENDISLVYITTHGYSMDYDLPPIDEKDGRDEALVPYEGFDQIYNFLSDDELNFYLSLLESKGVCVIIDSCHSGGFNDNKKSNARYVYENENSARSFIDGFIGELGSFNRVVLMSCEEDELSFGSSFSKLLIKGLNGHADENQDGVYTAEEIFYYAKEILDSYDRQHPTILDLYPGELPLTGLINEYNPNHIEKNLFFSFFLKVLKTR